MVSQLPFEKVSRQVTIRIDEKSDPAFGKSPFEQTIAERIENGFVVINKPRGPSSHQVGEYVRNILHAKTSGHSGTLDPNVTGVLAVGLNKATRVLQALLGAGKEYVCLMHIHQEFSEEKIRNTCKKFVGDIMQMPPVKSAVKRELRKRTIYYFDVIEIDGKDVLFRVGCQAGTYIRKLCSDIGDKLGCGAHMQQLIRTKAGSFTYAQMVSLNELVDAYAKWQGNQNDTQSEIQLKNMILPINSAVAHLPHVWVGDGAINPMCHGAPLAVPGVCKFQTNIAVGDMIAILSLKDELVCLATAQMTSEQMKNEKNGIAATLVRVVMDENLYPRMKKEQK